MSDKNRILVSIGREFGSGGHEVGKRLAAELGISFYDNELIKLAVQKTGYHEDYVKYNEEKMPDFTVGSLVSGFDICGPTPSGTIHDEEQQLIRELADKESCVTVGRSADYIWRDLPHISVFLYADIEDRIDRKMALLSPEDAAKTDRAAMEKHIKQVDRERRKFYEFYTDREWGKPESYDLLINTSRTGINGAVEIIKAYVGSGNDETIMPD